MDSSIDENNNFNLHEDGWLESASEDSNMSSDTSVEGTDDPYVVTAKTLYALRRRGSAPEGAGGSVHGAASSTLGKARGGGAEGVQGERQDAGFECDASRSGHRRAVEIWREVKTKLNRMIEEADLTLVQVIVLSIAYGQVEIARAVADTREEPTLREEKEHALRVEKEPVK